MEEKNTEIKAPAQTVPTITRKIGKTTYVVGIHFSETSKETLQDKILRMAKRDIQTGNF